MNKESFHSLENPQNLNKPEKTLETKFNSPLNNAFENFEISPELELSLEDLTREETTLLQRFRGKTKDLVKILVLITTLSGSAEFIRPTTAFAQEEQKIELKEKAPEQIKKEQAQKIAERFKAQYLESNLLPNDYQSLIDKHGSIEVASFWLAQSMAQKIMDKIQEEQGIAQDYRTDVIGGEIFVGHTDHLQDVGRDLEGWSVGELAERIAQQFSDKFTLETIPHDEIKEDVVQSLIQKGINFTEANKFASGSQLQDILEIIEKIETQDPSSMKLKFFALKHGGGGWGHKNTIYLRSDIFNPDKSRDRFKGYPEIRVKWVFAHEMGHLSYDDLSEQEQEKWRELQSKKDFESMIENSYDGDHRYPEMFSYYFVNRDDMIKQIDSEQDSELKEKLIQQFNFIADKCNGRLFNESLRELKSTK